jgi:hypothetical protein
MDRYASRPNNPNSTFAPSQGVAAPSADMMRHKAAKYHYKIQALLNSNYISKGAGVPAGYEQYMKPFEG